MSKAAGSGEAGAAVSDGAKVGVVVGRRGVLVAVGDGAGVSVAMVVGRGMNGMGVTKPEAAWLTNWQEIRNRARKAIQRRMVIKLYLFPGNSKKA
jgi:hypothetical protein